jgi:hypothetical protein
MRWCVSVAMALWVKLHVRVEMSHVFHEAGCGRRRPGRESKFGAPDPRRFETSRLY